MYYANTIEMHDYYRDSKDIIWDRKILVGEVCFSLENISRWAGIVSAVGRFELNMIIELKNKYRNGQTYFNLSRNYIFEIPYLL